MTGTTDTGDLISGESLRKVELPKTFRKLIGIVPRFSQKISYVVITIMIITAYVTSATLRRETNIVVAYSISIVLQKLLK